MAIDPNVREMGIETVEKSTEVQGSYLRGEISAVETYRDGPGEDYRVEHSR